MDGRHSAGKAVDDCKAILFSGKNAGEIHLFFAVNSSDQQLENIPDLIDQLMKLLSRQNSTEPFRPPEPFHPEATVTDLAGHVRQQERRLHGRRVVRAREDHAAQRLQSVHPFVSLIRITGISQAH